MIPRKEGMPQYATCRSQQLDQKVNKSLLKGLVLSQMGYAPVSDGEQTELWNATKLLYFEICSSIM